MSRYDKALTALAVFEAIRDDNPQNLHAVISSLSDGELLEGFYVLTESLLATSAAANGTDVESVVELQRAMYLNASTGAA